MLALLSVCTRICVTLLLTVAFPVTGNQTQEDFVNRFTEQTVKSEPFLFQHKHSIILNIRAVSYDYENLLHYSTDNMNINVQFLHTRKKMTRKIKNNQLGKKKETAHIS